jgi:hypothetical protein
MDTIPLHVRNPLGTTASFISGTTAGGYPTDPVAVSAFAEGTSNAGRFNAAGDGHAVIGQAAGLGNVFHGTSTGTGYSGLFEGGLGVKVDGDLEATGSFKLPSGAADGLVLTSDASGVASWQPGTSGSPWSSTGSKVTPSDTSSVVGIGVTYPWSKRKLSLQSSGTVDSMALWVRSDSGTAAGFFSGQTGGSYPATGTAVYARAGGSSNAGKFSASGDGIGISVSSSGIGDAVKAVAAGTGYAGQFVGGKGVRVEGDLRATGAFSLPTGAAAGYVLTSDASGVASWQARPGSHWTLDGGHVVLSDTSRNVSIGDTTFWTDWTKLSVETEGHEAISALRVRNKIGTAARFYSGGPGTLYSDLPAAVYGVGEDSSSGGCFVAWEGTGDAIYASTNGTGHSGYFTGGAGVYINGSLDVNGSTDLDDMYASGRVGIGTSSSNGKLCLTDNADGVALYFTNADRDITWTSGQSLQFGDWNGVTFNQRMRINADGNIGVNTTAPDGALHVKGNGDGIALHLSAASGDISWPTNNTLNMGTWDGAVFDEHLRITAGGNVGIGVSTTPNILTVQQYSSTDPIADSWETYSSRRWKENIEPLDGALDRVLQLQGVSYKWKATGEHDIGLIAEEVGKVVPEVVHYEENGVDAQSVDYARLTALLIEAVKELKSENDDLRRRLDAVEGNGTGK